MGACEGWGWVMAEDRGIHERNSTKEMMVGGNGLGVYLLNLRRGNRMRGGTRCMARMAMDTERMGSARVETAAEQEWVSHLGVLSVSHVSDTFPGLSNRKQENHKTPYKFRDRWERPMRGV